jgi:hypothetical protein
MAAPSIAHAAPASHRGRYPRPVRRLALLALVAFAATAGLDWPAPPGAGPVRYADLCAAVAAAGFALSGPRHGAWVPALWPALGLAAWTALSAAVHGAGAAVALGAAELAAVLGLAAALGREAAARDRVLRAWVAGAAVACTVGLLAAALAAAGIDPAPLHAGGGELGWAWRPAGLCRTGMLAAWTLVPFLILCLDGRRLCAGAPPPLQAVLGGSKRLTNSPARLADR